MVNNINSKNFRAIDSQLGSEENICSASSLKTPCSLLMFVTWEWTCKRVPWPFVSLFLPSEWFSSMEFRVSLGLCQRNQYKYLLALHFTRVLKMFFSYLTSSSSKEQSGSIPSLWVWSVTTSWTKYTELKEVSYSPHQGAHETLLTFVFHQPLWGSQWTQKQWEFQHTLLT